MTSLIRHESFTQAGARYGAYVFMAGLVLAWWPALATGITMIAIVVVFSMIRGLING